MPHAAPQGLFETRVESERVAISVSNEEQWRGICRVLGADDWRISETLSTHRGRLEAHDMLCARLSAWIRTRSREEVIEAFLADPAADKRDRGNLGVIAELKTAIKEKDAKMFTLEQLRDQAVTAAVGRG